MSTPRSPDNRLLVILIRTALLTAVYFTAGKLGLKLAFVHANATAVWAPTGIALAAFLFLGNQIWPAIFLGAFLTNVTTAGTVSTSIAIAAGNTLEGVVGAYFVNRFAGGRNVFNRAPDIFRFTLYAAITSTVLSATIGVMSLILGGFAAWANFFPIWLTWWLGDASGDLIVAPFLVLWLQNPSWPWKGWQIFEVLLLFIFLLFAGQAIFGSLTPLGVKNYPLSFICLPVLIWASFRFSQREAATVVLILSGMAIWGTLQGFGPFAARTHHEALLLLQGFMGTISITTLALAALVSERRRIGDALWRANQALEVRVGKRTADLEKTAVALEKTIHERKKTQEELLKRKEQLARSEAELEQLQLFAFFASHDLQEPIHKIINFGDALKKTGAQRLDEETRLYIDRIQKSSVRMSEMVEKFREFSKAAFGEGDKQMIDLGNVITAVLSDLDLRITETGARIELNNLPMVYANSMQMHLLFQNLISNSIKFCKKEESPKIVISSRAMDSGWVEVRLEDNGIGFEEKYAGEIFKPFKRVSMGTGLEGAGLGLAICERIVLRHGGTIAARSAPGKGAVFIIKLPAKCRVGEENT